MSKLVKILLVTALVLLLLLSGMIAVPRYLMGIDIFDLSGWSTDESGLVKYLDYHGHPNTGWQTIDGHTYYFQPDSGCMATGWVQVEGKYYYLDASGIRRTGWLTLPEGNYYVDPQTAAAVSGWTELDGSTYYLAENGKVCTGLTEIDGELYFLGTDGRRVSGWTEAEGRRYFLDEAGRITTGWADTDLGRCYFREDGSLGTGWTDTNEGRFFLTAQGTIATGWLQTNEGRIYLDAQGQPGSGWTDTDEGRCYLNESGIALTGWQELEGKQYYFRENGILAIGKVILEERNYYFASNGEMVWLVNKWNPLPDDYEVELTAYGSHEIAAEAHDALVEMIAQIQSLGYYKVTSIHRSVRTQQNIWDRYYNNYRAVGCGHEEAERLTGQTVAVPGTSEHHLGYAVDIDGVKPVHNWLAEHSWEYGFIVRFPEDKTEITGIEYEPWHYRYVGRELAEELYNLGLTLEEYMDMLTKQAGSDAGTASDPEKFG